MGTSLGVGAFRLAARASEAGITRVAATPTLTHATERAPIAVRSFGEAVMQGRASSLTVEGSYAGDRAFLSEVAQLKDLMTKAITRRSIVPQDVLPNVDLPPEYGQFLLGRAPEGLRQVRSVQINMRPYPEYVRGGLEAERIVAAQTPQFPGVFTDLNIIVKEPIALARMNSVVAELRGVPRVTIRTLAPEEGSVQMIRDADSLARRLRAIGVRVTRSDEVVVPPGEGWNVANPAFNVELRPVQRLPDARQWALNPGEISVGVDPATSSVRVMALSPSARGLAAPIDFTRQFTTLSALPPGDVGLLATRLAPTLNQALTMRLGAGRATEILERVGIDGDRPAELVFSELPQAEMVRLADDIVDEATITPPGLTPEERLELRRLISRSQESALEIRRGEPRRVATLAPEVSPELQELVARGVAPATVALRPEVAARTELRELVERSGFAPEMPAPAAVAPEVTPQLQRAVAPTVARPSAEVMDRPVGATPELQELVARGVAPATPVPIVRFNPRQIGVRLATLTRTANRAEMGRPLTDLEQARARNYIEDLSAVALTPAQQARLDAELARLGGAERVPLEERLTPREIAARLDTLERLAQQARPLSDLQRRQAVSRAETLARAQLTPQQRAQLERHTERLTPRVPEMPRPRAPELLRTTTVTEPPRVPTTPRIPETPRVPTPGRIPPTSEPPRVPPRVPPPATPPRVPPPDTPPRRPEFDGEPLEPDDADAGLQLREIGFNRGILDTKVDLTTGEAQSVQDIASVPQTGLKRSIQPLSYGTETPQVTRVKMGFHDAVFDQRGELVGWVDAGKAIPDELVQRARTNDQLQSRPRQRNRTEFRSRSIRGRRL